MAPKGSPHFPNRQKEIDEMKMDVEENIKNNKVLVKDETETFVGISNFMFALSMIFE